MIFLAFHILGYVLTVFAVARAVPVVNARRRANRYRDLLLRITKLEGELGLGVFWAKDEVDLFKPILTRPQHGEHQNLRDYAFRCYGCEKIVRYADYYERSARDVRDANHVFCNDCLPVVTRG